MTHDFPGDGTRAPKTAELALPAPVLALLAGGGAETVAAALQPYALRIETGGGMARARGHRLAVELFEKLAARLAAPASEGRAPTREALAETLAAFLEEQLKFDLAFRLQGTPQAVRPLSLAQASFMHALLEDPHQLLFGVGPTGTGKTHLALAAGLELLATGKVGQLVVTRPLILWEGETMTAARRADLIDEGQLTSVEDELHALIGLEATRRLAAQGKLELAPMGRLRGRTFNGAFILVDEAQNLRVQQMRMVLTRLGRGSRMVVLGDPEQCDLPGDEPSGLSDILERLRGRDLAQVHGFRRGEIVRNPLVAEIEGLYAEPAAAVGRRAA